MLVGQDGLVDRLILALLAGGHVLIEGVPGLAKTLAVSTLADAVDCRFSRIQFTPDMLPGDVTGTQIFNPREGTYSVRKGPVFGNLVLADEINRAPAKVQSALLEAMQERQVTLGEETFRLEEPFLVMATQNPNRAGGHLPAPRGPARPLRDEASRRVSEPGRRGSDHRPHGRRGERAAGRSGVERGRDPRRPARRYAKCSWTRRSSATRWSSRPRRGTRRRPGCPTSRTSSSTALRCAGRSPWCSSPRPTPCSRAGATRARTT